MSVELDLTSLLPPHSLLAENYWSKTKQINKRKLFGEKEIAYILIVVVLHDYLCFSKLNNCISKNSELYCANYISINLI